METNFNAAAEAAKIERMAKQCLDAYMNSKEIDAHEDEQALAKELASVWGDPEKLLAVGSELDKIGRLTFSSLPDIEVGYDPDRRTIPSMIFSSALWDDACCDGTRIAVTASSKSIDLTVHLDKVKSKPALHWSEPLPDSPKPTN